MGGASSSSSAAASLAQGPGLHLLAHAALASPPAGECEGTLGIKSSWPAAIRTVYGDQERFEMVYFAPYQVGCCG